MKTLLALLALFVLSNAQEDLVNQAKQCLQQADKLACVERLLGTDLVDAKQKLEALLNGADQKVIAFVKEQGDKIHQFLNSQQGYISQVHDKAHEYKEKAQAWIKEHLGRRKRDLPTQEEVRLGRQIKICIEVTQDKAQCIQKILGDLKNKFDLVKLETIAKYEDVLEELKEFFEFQKNGGTLKQFLESKKQQQAKPRPQTRSGTGIPQLDAIISLQHVMKECNASLPNQDVLRCLVSLFGPQGTQFKNAVETLVNSNPVLKQFVQTEGKQLADFLDSNPGVVGRIYDALKDTRTFLKSVMSTIYSWTG